MHSSADAQIEDVAAIPTAAQILSEDRLRLLKTANRGVSELEGERRGIGPLNLQLYCSRRHDGFGFAGVAERFCLPYKGV